MADASEPPVPIAIGIGCRRGCPAETIVTLVKRVIEEIGKPVTAQLFSIETKRGEPGLAAASRALGLPLVFLPGSDLAGVLGGVTIRSARVEAAVGVGSVAEAAALAGIGPGGTLIVPRRTEQGATCAAASRHPV